MGLAEPVKRYVDVQLEVLILRKAMLGDFKYAIRFEPVRRKVDVADSIITNEQIDDLRQFLSQRRLAAAKPQICKRRSVLGKLNDLLPGKVTLLVKLIPIEARLACRVAMRRDKKDDGIQLSLAVDPPKTRVSFGDTSL